jgi:hypothetical protein
VCSNGNQRCIDLVAGLVSSTEVEHVGYNQTGAPALSLLIAFGANVPDLVTLDYDGNYLQIARVWAGAIRVSLPVPLAPQQTFRISWPATGSVSAVGLRFSQLVEVS